MCRGRDDFIIALLVRLEAWAGVAGITRQVLTRWMMLGMMSSMPVKYCQAFPRKKIHT